MTVVELARVVGRRNGRYRLAAFLAIAAPAVQAQAPQSGGTLSLIVQPEPPTLMLGLNKLGPVSFVGADVWIAR